jgi:hypothetical protein
VRAGLAFALVVTLVLGLPRLFTPSTRLLMQAVGDLGPISGWRCALSATYSYDPRREHADSTLLSEAPEEMLVANVPGIVVERVEANLRGGDTVLWTRASGDAHGQRRVYVLSPGTLQPLVSGIQDPALTVCNVHLGRWQIVSEHGLQ